MQKLRPKCFYQRSPSSNTKCVNNLVILLLLAILSLPTYSYSITSDSLKVLIDRSTSDNQRLALMNELCEYYIGKDLQKALICVEQSIVLSEKATDKVEKVNAYFLKGKALDETSNRDLALEYFKKAELLAEEIGMSETRADILISIANYYNYVSRDSAKTVQYFLKSGEVSEASFYNEGRGRAYARLANFYANYNQVEKAEDYLEKATTFFMKESFGPAKVAHYYNDVGDKIWDDDPTKAMDLYLKGMQFEEIPKLKANLAKVHSFIGEPELALNYLNEAIPELRKNERARLFGMALAQLAEVHLQLQNYDAAEKVCDESIELLSPLGRTDKRALPVFYRIKGLIAQIRGNDKLALSLLNKGHDVAIKVKRREERVRATLALGEFYITKDAKQAKKYCKKVIRDYNRGAVRGVKVDACDCLYTIYKEEKNSTEALNYLEQIRMVSDSLNQLNIKRSIKINSILNLKDKQISEQALQKEIQYLLIIGLLIATFLAGLLIAFLSRTNSRMAKKNTEINEKKNELTILNSSLENSNTQLEKSNEALERFVHIASHDLKTPLRSIVSYIGLLRMKLSNETNSLVKESLDFIESGGIRMNHILEDVLEYSMLENDITKMEEVIDLNKVVSEIAEIQKNLPGYQSLKFEIENLPTIKWHHSKIFILLQNIVENGIKYNESDNPTIKIYSSQTANTTSIHIEDNGIGIDEKYFDEVFVMFKRIHTQAEYDGTGLGLATCKKITEEMNGDLSVKSELGKGTTFKIDFPNELLHEEVSVD